MRSTLPYQQASAYGKRKARQRLRRRAGIEPVIGHLKSDFRLLLYKSRLVQKFDYPI